MRENSACEIRTRNKNHEYNFGANSTLTADLKAASYYRFCCEGLYRRNKKNIFIGFYVNPLSRTNWEKKSLKCSNWTTYHFSFWHSKTSDDADTVVWNLSPLDRLFRNLFISELMMNFDANFPVKFSRDFFSFIVMSCYHDDNCCKLLYCARAALLLEFWLFALALCRCSPHTGTLNLNIALTIQH